jgi:hypothetical protein
LEIPFPVSKTPLILYTLNYQREHYEELARKTHSFSEANLRQRAKENLKQLGAVYE